MLSSSVFKVKSCYWSLNKGKIYVTNEFLWASIGTISWRKVQLKSFASTICVENVFHTPQGLGGQEKFYPVVISYVMIVVMGFRSPLHVPHAESKMSSLFPQTIRQYLPKLREIFPIPKTAFNSLNQFYCFRLNITKQCSIEQSGKCYVIKRSFIGTN